MGAGLGYLDPLGGGGFNGFTGNHRSKDLWGMGSRFCGLLAPAGKALCPPLMVIFFGARLGETCIR